MSRTPYCPHCSNEGRVILDHPPVEVANIAPFGAPCPMCETGKAVERGLFKGAGFWTPSRLRSLSWENGVTILHNRRCRFARDDNDMYPCGQPARHTYCDYHEVEANRKSFVLQKPESLPAFGSLQIDAKDQAKIDATKGQNQPVKVEQ